MVNVNFFRGIAMRKTLLFSFLSLTLTLGASEAAFAGKVTVRSATPKIVSQSEQPDHADLTPEQLTPKVRNNNGIQNEMSPDPELIDKTQEQRTTTEDPNASADAFKVYQQLTYNDMPPIGKLENIGLGHMPLLTSWFFFPPGHDKEDVDDAVRERVIHHAQIRMEDGKSYVLDIEHWPTGANQTSETRAETVRKMSEIVDIIRSVHPNVKLGYYSMVPGRNYWDVYENCAWNDDRHDLCLANQQRWHDANTELLPLVEKMDFLFPSVYTFYNAPEGWTHYARANIREAKRLAELAGGKSVYAYIWPRYHQSAPQGLPYTPIDGAYWRHQLEVIYQEGIDGLVMWDHFPARPFEYVRQNEEWWTQAMDFLGEIHPRRPLRKISD